MLVALDARLSADQRRRIDAELRQALSAGRNLTLTTRIGDLDIAQRRPGVPPWAVLAADAEQTTLGEVPHRPRVGRADRFQVGWPQ